MNLYTKEFFRQYQNYLELIKNPIFKIYKSFLIREILQFNQLEIILISYLKDFLVNFLLFLILKLILFHLFAYRILNFQQNHAMYQNIFLQYLIQILQSIIILKSEFVSFFLSIRIKIIQVHFSFLVLIDPL
ncbi:hypothetical protein IMG5_084950 [Ichthyophthirius multifiliis]|uniref:Transmembrane protein n=1 Tax=Ichthyophthirius multifiliis TaxID=5932 RepID=G0QQW7_ICHMU|nr:hypothetical protein IMG5_084950 [Ichthyophthirius multifiliis]EGR32397.1 hypothetical protein IMG5_084950 [Ichthyophthirius multifiliis]|eukprot:XP_004035883.1 hypothetical protein IMG5_084950 [Ichthyophthirius multifiliis]